MKDLQIDSWGVCCVNEDGEKYWSLGGQGWKDKSDMEPGESAVFSPETFNEGDEIRVFTHSPPEESHERNA